MLMFQNICVGTFWDGGGDARELETEPKWGVVDGGARRSVSVPKMIRAAVEVTATMET